MLSYTLPVSPSIQTMPHVLAGAIQLRPNTAILYFVSKTYGEFSERKATTIPAGVIANFEVEEGSYISYVQVKLKGVVRVVEMPPKKAA